MTTRSFFPNSAPHILVPIKGAHGTLQVRWIEALDSHVLYFDASKIAAHHNGYSCFALARRIDAAWSGKGTAAHALEQYDHILRCGGMGASERAVAHIANGLPNIGYEP